MGYSEFWLHAYVWRFDFLCVIAHTITALFFIIMHESEMEWIHPILEGGEGGITFRFSRLLLWLPSPLWNEICSKKKEFASCGRTQMTSKTRTFFHRVTTVGIVSHSLYFISVKFVLMPSGQVVTLACTLGQSLEQLKQHFSTELKMPANVIMLMFDGKLRVHCFKHF